MAGIIFVRHGRSVANENGIVADAHSPLVAEGLAQARKTAQELKGRGVQGVAHSPYLRTQQTAEAIAAELGINAAQIWPIEELRERGFGRLESEPKDHASDWYFTTEGATIEPREALLVRMQLCLKKLQEIAQKEGCVLAVGHAVSGFYLLQVAKGRTNFTDFDPPSQMSNADFVEL